MSEMGSSSMAAPTLSFRSDLRVYPPRLDSGDSHYTIYDPASDLSYSLGANELMVARLFDGQRSLADIMAHMESQHRRRMLLEKLACFEKRLHQLGILSVPGAAPDARVCDPAAGISYGPFKKLLVITLLRMQPAALLDFVYERFGWLCSRAFVLQGLLAILAAIVVVVLRYGEFSDDVVAVYGNGIGWLAWHYPVVVASIAVHELGHALACRLYRVRVTDFGIAIYLLMATGWARPLQGDWKALTRHERMVTIFMGPYASLLFSAVGVALWLVTSPGSAWHTLSIVMTVSASLSLVPTLLPIFNGDTYLALTEYLRLPRLRQRAFQYVKETLRSRKHEESLTPRRRALYWATVVATLLGWVLAWALLLSLLVRIFRP
jgi:putative peptide zinc metalloprotease protein